ncbi:MAG: hypothetical protein IJY94_07340 [Clostridia bacterium]|nr:hypothetical protein [Clostridia bacterium]
MTYLLNDYGKLYSVFLDNELVFGYGRAMVSIKLLCCDFEYEGNGIILYGSKENGLLRSYNKLTLSDKPSFCAMHDGRAEIKPLNGSRIIQNEKDGAYSFTCVNGESSLTLMLDGSCRCEGNTVYFRRGRTEIRFSEPTAPKAKRAGCGFEYEAQRCLALMTENGETSAESELIPLLTLVDGLKNASYEPSRAESIKAIIADMSEESRITAQAVLNRYYRAFGIEKR